MNPPATGARYSVTCYFVDGSEAIYDGLSVSDLVAVIDTFDQTQVAHCQILAPIEVRRRAALNQMPTPTTQQWYGLRKWVLYGDMSEVEAPHAGRIQLWEASEHMEGRRTQ